MQRKEVDIAIEWAAKEGWNPGFRDAACYFTADSNGFLVGFLGDEPISTISVVKYGKSFGFLGLYIVKPEYRGKGYGMQIWNAGVRYLEERIIGLDGVMAQRDNYKKTGFRLAFRHIRYEGVSGGAWPENADVVKLSTLPFEIINTYDEPFFPANRSRFIRSWIDQPECHALGIMQDGELSGYGVIRKCRSGFKVGPLYADSPELAESLFLALKSKVEPSEPVFLDAPEVNRDAVALAERHDMKISFETARMYTAEMPEMPLNRVFGVTSLEIG